MKRAGDDVKLKMLWWHGERPVRGDCLRTGTGRRYLIIDVKWPTLHCIVMAKDEHYDGKIFEFQWSPRRRLAPQNLFAIAP